MVFLQLARKNVTRKRERSILTIVGVLLAVGSFTALLSIAEGIYQRTEAELNGRKVHLYILPRGTTPLPIGVMPGTSESLDPSLPEQLGRQLAPVESATGVYRSIHQAGGRLVVMWGIEADKFQLYLPAVRLRGGELPRGLGEVAVGVRLAEELKLSLGGTLNVGNNALKVVGYVDSVAEFQNYFCYVVPGEAMALTNARGPHEIWVQLKDANLAQGVAGEISRTFQQVTVYPEPDYLGRSMEIIRYAWLLQFAIAIIGVIIAMTAAMNTMLMSTYERMKEFATLRAIGAPRNTVLAMIGAESIMLSLIGGLGGIILGLLGSFVLDAAVVAVFRTSFPMASVTPLLVFFGLLLSVLVGVVGAVLPCIIIYRMDIMTGLRWD